MLIERRTKIAPVLPIFIRIIFLVVFKNFHEKKLDGHETYIIIQSLPILQYIKMSQLQLAKEDADGGEALATSKNDRTIAALLDEGGDDFPILEHVAVVEVEGNENIPEHISAMRVDEGDRALAALLNDESDRALAAHLDEEVDDEVNSALTPLLNRALAALLDDAGDRALAALVDVDGGDDEAFAAFLDTEVRK